MIARPSWRGYLVPMHRPLVIAHRGASGYEYENSRAAFRRAVALDADGAELDVHATRDGAIVVHHDPELPAGRIATLSFDEARACRLPNGETLPLLAEVLEILGDREAWIEVKSLPPAHDASLLAVIAGAKHPGRCSIHSFDHRIVRRLSGRQSTLRCGVLLSAYVLDPIAVMERASASVLWQEWHLIDEDLVNLVHSSGREVIAWTVNEIGEMERLAAIGVDGICGNYPDRVRIATGAKAPFRATDQWG